MIMLSLYRLYCKNIDQYSPKMLYKTSSCKSFFSPKIPILTTVKSQNILASKIFNRLILNSGE